MLIRNVLILSLLIPVFAYSEPMDTESSHQHLPVIQQDRWGEIRMSPDANWDSYTKMQVQAISVEFRKNWVRDQRRRGGGTINEKEIERIKADLARQVYEAVTGEWAGDGGFEITRQPGAGVLQFSTRVVDLDLVVPNRAKNYIGDSLGDSLANMTLELEIRDSVSGELLLSSTRYEEDPYRGYFEVSNSATLNRRLRLMLQRWTSWMRKSLETAMSESS